jgi:Ca2+-binding RTX toxin-like protein
MAVVTELADPGIITLTNTATGAVLTSHFRADLFDSDSGQLSIDSGQLEVSNGFAASLADLINAAVLAGDPIPSFNLGSDVQVELTGDVAGFIKLNDAILAAGLTVFDVFSGTSPDNIGVRVKDSTGNMQFVVSNFLGLELFGFVRGLESTDDNATLFINLENFDENFPLTGIASVQVFGTIEEFKNDPRDLTGSAFSGVTLVILDGTAEYDAALAAGDFSPTTGNLSAAGFTSLTGSVAELADVADHFSTTALAGQIGLAVARDSAAALEGNIATLGVLFVVLVDELGVIEELESTGIAHPEVSAAYSAGQVVFIEAFGTMADIISKETTLDRSASPTNILHNVGLLTVADDGAVILAALDAGDWPFDAGIDVVDVVSGTLNIQAAQLPAFPGTGIVGDIRIVSTLSEWAAQDDTYTSNAFFAHLFPEAPASFVIADSTANLSDLSSLSAGLQARIDRTESTDTGGAVFSFDTDAFSAGAVSIAGVFDAATDILNISAITLFTGAGEANQDFAFIDAGQNFGLRALTHLDGKNPVDIRISEGSTHIEFDGLVGAYDGTVDATIILANNVASSLDVSNFFGVPAVDRISQADYENLELIPPFELNRFEGVNVFLDSALDAWNFIANEYWGAPPLRGPVIVDGSSAEGDVMIGTTGNDTQLGDQLFPLVDDVIWADDGDDTAMGGAGNDYIDGWNGIDFLEGGVGDDTILGWFGTDTINGGEGKDFIDGEQDADIISGGDGEDTLLGSGGADVIDGGKANDWIAGGEGVDVLTGGNGDDIFSFTQGGSHNELGDQIVDFSPLGDEVKLNGAYLTTTNHPLYASYDLNPVPVDTNYFLRVLSTQFAVNRSFPSGEGFITQAVDSANSAVVHAGQNLPVLFNGAPTTGSGYQTAFSKLLTGLYAQSTATNHTIMDSVTNVTTAAARYIAFALISRSEGAADPKLMMAYIVNGTAGVNTGTSGNPVGNLNQITSEEIQSIVTVASLGGVSSLNAGNLLAGSLDLFLI